MLPLALPNGKAVPDLVTNASRPKGLPILGNLFQIPSERPWLVYSDWKKTYGDMIYLEAMGQSMMIVNSLSVATDLLEKRGNNYSDRPGSSPAYDILGFEWMVGLMNCGPEFTSHRRAFQQHLNPRKVPIFSPIIHEEGMSFVRRLLKDPKDFRKCSRMYFGMVLMRVAFGSTDPVYNADLIGKAEIVSKGFSEAGLPGKYLVNVFPFLRFVPAWFPGAGWKRTLLEINGITKELIIDSFNDVRDRVRAGNQSREYPCVASGLIEELPPENSPEYAEREYVARATAVASYAGGSDTTGGTTEALFAALASNVEVQLQAQKEIDSVLGVGNLPRPEDIPRLQYIQAITKEILRWFVVTPFALPHTIKEDDEYQGYFLPKGTAIFPNLWFMLHDPEVFKDPLKFDPERYLKDGKINPDVLDSETAAFGFGRRVCPGRYLALDSLGYMIACLLAVFIVRPAKDSHGKSIPINVEITSGVIVYVSPDHLVDETY
ncbi:cytochrome P450 [Coprinopsis cinerea okayama7|uniref:Cytochrome P450 n=1 Tax=Coprinopsis cinerea (strain Okayama-7 / 130 / ATCC MYA-4618 / FGSC 9003) TaxID=240176 RepID=A8PAK4_COPC7|nr:cytochrome P450 [Coprinopsis cinerea okayama7\|eukprot:XP_001840001.2 cytochrome P450 [Coprinopsis cinerea okayama7\